MKHPRKPKHKTEADLIVEDDLSKLHLLCVAELRFYGWRQWKFDYAVPKLKLAIEIEGFGPRGHGGIGRHQSPDGFQGDLDKYNTAAELGWIVFRFSTEDVKRGHVFVRVRKWLETTGKFPQ